MHQTRLFVKGESLDKKNQCYIETKNLDGETNLKHKVGPKDLFTKEETKCKKMHELLNTP